jgi:hypothetical protein
VSRCKAAIERRHLRRDVRIGPRAVRRFNPGPGLGPARLRAICHADPAVTLRVYSHVLREHALGVGDLFAQAVKAAVSKSVSKPGQQI